MSTEQNNYLPTPWINAALTSGATLVIGQVMQSKWFQASLFWKNQGVERGQISQSLSGAISELEKKLAQKSQY